MSNMVIEKLGNDERWTLHDLYRNNALFTQWERVLDKCEERYTKIDTTSLWKHSVKVLQILKDTTYRRDEMVRFLIAEMERDNANKLQVEAVMAIVLTQLANAKEKEHVDEAHPNDTMCISILEHYYFKNGFFKFLIDKHRQLDKDFDGSPIVITPHDPMTEEISLENLPQTTQESIETKVQRVLEKTKGARLYFMSEWGNWEKLWQQALKDEEFYVMIDEVNPRGNAWDMNLKMVANVMGMFSTIRDIKVSANKLNTCLDGSDRNSYISRCQDYGNRTYCALNEAQCKRIRELMKAL